MTPAAVALRTGKFVRRRRRALVVAWALAFAVSLAVPVALRPPDERSPLGELSVNRGFERGTPPWVAIEQGVLRRTTKDAHTGAAAAAVTATAADSRYGIQWISAVTGPKAGERYRFKVMVKAGPGSVGTRVVMRMVENAGGTDVETLDEDFVELDRTWQELDVTETLDTDDLVALDLELVVGESDAAGETFFVDSVSFARIDPLAEGLSPRRGALR